MLVVTCKLSVVGISNRRLFAWVKDRNHAKGMLAIPFMPV